MRLFVNPFFIGAVIGFFWGHQSIGSAFMGAFLFGIPLWMIGGPTLEYLVRRRRERQERRGRQ